MKTRYVYSFSVMGRELTDEERAFIRTYAMGLTGTDCRVLPTPVQTSPELDDKKEPNT